MTEVGRNKRVLAFLRNEIGLQKEQFFLWWPVFLAIGIGGYFSLPFEPPLFVGMILVGLAVSVFVLSFGSYRLRFGCFLLLLMCFGFLAGQVGTWVSYTPMLAKKLGPVDVVGTVKAIENLGPGAGSRIVFSDLDIEKLSAAQTPVTVRLKVRKDEGVQVGQRVKVLAQLMPPSMPVLPGGFNFQRYMFFRQIGAVGFAYYAPDILEESGVDAGGLLNGVRDGVRGRVGGALEHPVSAMALALLMAERSAIPKADKEAMRGSGLAHILAISGLHVGLFSGVIFFVARLFMVFIPGFALKHPVKKYAAVIAFCGAFFYASLAGFPIPTQRALIMVGIVFLAVLLDRSPFSLRLVAFAAMVVLLISPDSLVSPSFQMSFAAVTGLIAFYEWLRPWYRVVQARRGVLNRFALYFLGISMTTIVASLATAPFALYHFHQIPTYSLFANVLAMPIMAIVIMPAAVLSLFLMPLGLEAGPLFVMGWGIEQLLSVAHWFSESKFSVLRMVMFSSGVLLLFVVGVLIVILWRGYLKWVAVPIIGLSVLLMFVRAPYDVLMSSNFKLVSFRDDLGVYHVSSRRSERFVLKNWESAMGLAQGAMVRWPREGGDDVFRCDDAGCRLNLKGHRLSFIKDAQSVAVECDWADLIIVEDFVKRKPCDGAMVLSKGNGYRHGAHGIYFRHGAVDIRRVSDITGKRAWTARKNKWN